MRDVIWMLSANYKERDYDRMPVEEQAPFIDETCIKDRIHFTFNKEYSFEKIRQYLQTLGLDVLKSQKEMKVVVIKDPK